MAKKKSKTAPKKSHRDLDREISEFLGQRPSALGRLAPRTKPAAKSERFVFRAIGKEGEPWTVWMHAFKRACGVYAIKEHGKVVYVGSSKSRLYDTVTRHFQSWRRGKKYWNGKGYGSKGGYGHDPGMTYKRNECEVGVITVPCGAQLSEEAAMIHRFKPRDNLVANPDGGEFEEELEEAPF